MSREAIAAAAVTVLLLGGCDVGDPGPCVIADGQEPLNGRTHEQVLEELSEPDSGWPEVPDGDWERENAGGAIVYRNGDAEVSFTDDALVSVGTC